jgi:hypothetical protein
MVPVLSGPGPLDVRIKRLARQRDDLQDINRRLKLDLEEERNRAFANRGAGSQEELERYYHMTRSGECDLGMLVRNIG